MGTNYYFSCKSCGANKVHVGKKSAGWPFLSNYAIDDIERIYCDGDFYLEDEYGQKLDFWEFLKKYRGDWRVDTSSSPMEWS